jgi:deazaflavin-dependent oxidoreductase (nitroreductase family)
MHTVNRCVRALLRSPLHGALSRSVVLLSFRGRRSGRWFTTPVQYAPWADALVVVPGHADRKQWWRNLEGGAPVRLHLRGRDVDADAALVRGEAADAALAPYFERFPRARKVLADQHLAVVVHPTSA